MDIEMEKRISGYIENEKNHLEIIAEIRNALEGTSYQKYWKEDRFILRYDQIDGKKLLNRKFVDQNRKIALEIMMAKRGKVTLLEATFGYTAYLRHGTLALKREQFAYVQSLQSMLEETGLLLAYHQEKDSYVWLGSRGGHASSESDLKTFSIQLVEKGKDDIY